tara:strand:+ start:639 stop:2012 length:1374 start_codon:yes stop_codon:yes gene_type:complete
MIFGRSLTGLTFLGYRIGEILVLFAFLVSISTFTSFYSQLIDKKILITNRMLVISFFIYVYISGGSLTDSYTYKSSSYIWTFAFLYLGVIAHNVFKKKPFEIKYMLLPLPITYILSSVYYPGYIQNFFLRYSDVFDFLKASDLLLLFVVTNYLYFINGSSKKNSFIYLILSASVFFPYMAFKSKGAIVPGVVFILLILFQYREFIFTKIFLSLAILLTGTILFGLSTIRTFGSVQNVDYSMFFSEREENTPMHERFTNFQSIVKTQPERYEESVIPERYQQQKVSEVSEEIYINIVAPEKEYTNVTQFWIFTLADGRLYSNETNIDYRLQIWQDVLIDLRLQGQLIRGYAFNEIIPAMTPAERRGWDGSNENVHNYFINIIARGGLFHLFLFFILNFYIIRNWYIKNHNFLILTYITPVILTALFDVTMESVRYPLIYYSFLGFFMQYETINKQEII